MKKIIVCLVLALVLVGCKSKAWYEGTWYLVQNPESEDGWIEISGDKFAMRKVSGEVMEVEGGLVFTSLTHGSDRGIKVERDGIIVLVHEGDGYMYVKGKEKAIEANKRLMNLG